MGKFGDKVTEVADWASSAALADNTVASARKVTTLTIRIQPSGSKDLNALAKLALNEGARFSAPSEIPHYRLTKLGVGEQRGWKLSARPGSLMSVGFRFLLHETSPATLHPDDGC